MDSHRPPPATDGTRVAQEYLLRLSPGHSIKNFVDFYGIYLIKELGPDLYLVRIDPDPGPQAVSRRFLGAAGLVYIEPNVILKAQ